MDLLEQVKSSVDIVKVVGEYVRLKKAGGRPSYKGLCPSSTGRAPTRKFARGVFARSNPSLERWVPAESYRSITLGTFALWVIAFGPTERAQANPGRHDLLLLQ